MLIGIFLTTIITLVIFKDLAWNFFWKVCTFFTKPTGVLSKQKLLFLPNVNTNPKEEHEISDPLLFRYLINEETMKEQRNNSNLPEMLKAINAINILSKITEFETHRSSMGLLSDLINRLSDLMKAFHVFIVFKTSEKDGDYWWSLEKNLKYIVLQRSANKKDVKDKLHGNKRKRVQPIKENLKGKGTIRDFLAILWTHQIIEEKYHIMNSNCQSLVTLVSKQITEIGYEYEGIFKSSPTENDRSTEMLDLIYILSIAVKCDIPPLIPLIYYENIEFFDIVMESGKYDITAHFTHDELTLLNYAIMLSKTEMVRHLLNKWKANPASRDGEGMNALHRAAKNANENMDIIDLLLAHEKVDINEGDEKKGWTALHFAVRKSNFLAVKHLIDKGANPNICDKNGESPLHFAAYWGTDTKIIDLILKAKNNKGIDDVNEPGFTVLHTAAMAANEITAEYLIKNGADVNYRGKFGFTPLDWAALLAKDMKIIDLLLKNIKEEDIDQYNKDDQIFALTMSNLYGLEEEIIDRLKEKCIVHKITIDDEVDKTEMNDLHTAAKESHINATNQILEEGKFDNNASDKVGWTALYYAIIKSNVTATRYLIEKGANPNIAEEHGWTPLHCAAFFAKDMDIVELLLNHRDVDVNSLDNAGRNPLHYAIIKSNVTATRYLIEKGANPNAADDEGHTPLHWAAFFSNDMEIVELLLNHKDVDVNYLDNTGRNPLYYAKSNLHGLGETIANRFHEKGVVKTDGNNEPASNRVEKIQGIPKGLHFNEIVLNLSAKERQIGNMLRDNQITVTKKIENFATTALHDAIIESNVQHVRYLLEKGADVCKSTCSEHGTNALHAASKCAKTTELIDVILENGQFDINGGDNHGQTPLHHAILGDNATINTRHLIGKGADPTKRDKDGDTPFHMAAAFIKEFDILDRILANGKIDIEEKNESGMTALHMAIINSNLTTALYLLEKGANPNVADEHKRTPVHLAAKFANDMDIVELLLSKKQVDVNCVDDSERNALHYAKDNMHGLRERIANRLKKAVETENKTNESDIEKFKKPESGHQMVTKKCEIFWEDKVSDEKKTKRLTTTALIRAIVDSDVQEVRYLLENGADISKSTCEHQGVNALHVASRYAKTTELIDIVLETDKFDINEGDNDGDTPLHYAMQSTNKKIARYLIQKGANITIANAVGITPLHMAKAEGIDIADPLLNHNEKDINLLDQVHNSKLLVFFIIFLIVTSFIVSFHA